MYTHAQIKLREKLKKYKLTVLALVFCSILLVSVYATSHLWSAPASITISTSSPYIKVYMYPYPDKEVTSVNFGTWVPGTHAYIRLGVMNTHPNASVTLEWSSTLGDVTDKITDSWWTAPRTLAPGSSFGWEYQIYVASDCPFGTYSWTLYINGTL